jgi:hypothetical protein
MSLDASQRKVIAERYATGETIAALARDYDCGDATIWRCLHSGSTRPFVAAAPGAAA